MQRQHNVHGVSAALKLTKTKQYEKSKFAYNTSSSDREITFHLNNSRFLS